MPKRRKKRKINIRKILLVFFKICISLCLILYPYVSNYIFENRADGIVEAVEEYKTKIKTFFILESIDNLVKNGRVSALSGKLAGMLGIKILGQGSSEGKIELLRKIRGKDAIYKKTVQDMLANGYKGGNLVISQCFNKEKVQFLLDNLR